eukprot:CAMPEP_0173465630 /NCGR_PEP_ID=MMETSP1357-20121228/71984_1 /TAXON_ID=77926 /ORGANISM="Hemiselmis rufescens, Strain PCC563" /LENGTH=348 /DNA_ID=CAMNT_0014433623 /DNA_START=12 /DNA_END=1054 /DNA_ORIENTATION=+
MVRSARGLLAADSGGTSDPYCEVTIGKKKRKTKTIPKTLDPTWEESFTMPLEAGECTFPCDVFDHDVIGNSDFLGRALVDTRSLMMGRAREEWFPLGVRKSGEEAQGSLLLKLLKRQKGKPQEYLIEVLSARKLAAADRGGTSDPFVVVHAEGQKLKTKVIKATLTPEWGESFQVVIEEDAGKVSFEVFDYNTFGRNTHIGSSDIDTSALTPASPPVTKWVPLDIPPAGAGVKSIPKVARVGGTAYGDLHVRITRRFGDGGARPSSSGSDAGPKLKLAVDVLEARGLTAADRGGTSDPFCMISFPTLAKPLRTAVVAKTLDPVWNETHIIDARRGQHGVGSPRGGLGV